MGAVGAPVSLVCHAWGSTSTLQMGSRWGGNTQSSQSSLFGIEFLQCVAVGWDENDEKLRQLVFSSDWTLEAEGVLCIGVPRVKLW